MAEDQDLRNAITFIEYFGERYECTGFCKVPLFAWDKIVPSDNVCRYEMREELKINFEFLGVLMILAAWTSMAAFCVQYYMWRDYESSNSAISNYFKQRKEQLINELKRQAEEEAAAAAAAEAAK